VRKKVKSNDNKRKALVFARISRQLDEYDISPWQYALWLEAKAMAEDRRQWNEENGASEQIKTLREYVLAQWENARSDSRDYVNAEFERLIEFMGRWGGRINAPRKVKP